MPPTDAVVEVGSENAQSGRVMLNCTSNGLPAPSLTWTIGEQKVAWFEVVILIKTEDVR